MSDPSTAAIPRLGIKQQLTVYIGRLKGGTSG
jgi:hypothetical protein